MPRFPAFRRAPFRRALRCFRPRGTVAALAVALGLLGPAASGQGAEPSWTERALQATNETTSVGLIPAGERQPGWQGWFSDAWEGSKRIFRDGRSDLLLPLYSWHPAFAYPNRFDQNHYSYGAGIARTLIDEKDNERIVYALAFSDSHYDLQVMAGYGWMARWPLFAGLKGGLGYTVFVTARSDANYIPFPAILPLAGIGTDRVMFYGSWIPFSDVLFFFARISLPFDDRGPMPEAGKVAAAGPGAPAGGRFRANVVYGAAAYLNTDASGIDGVAGDNAWAPLVGYRRFFTERLALDLSVSRSDTLSLDLNSTRLGTFELMPVTVAAQYHLPDYHGVRLYAGLGAAYTRLTDQQMPGYSLSTSSISPLLQAGFSYHVTEALLLTGGLAVNFARNRLEQNGTNLGTVQLSPVSFSLGVGYAF
jgi:outer membrane protein W